MSTTPPPPPPPEDPFPSFGNGDNPDANGFGNGDDAVEQGRPNVAAERGRVFLVLGIVVVVILFLLYSIFSGDSSDKKNAPPVLPQASVPAPQAEPPPLPVIAEEPPPVPDTFPIPSVPEPTSLPQLRPQDDAAEKQKMLARLRSEMLLTGSGGGGGIFGSGSDSSSNAEMQSNDPNMQFAAAVARSNTKAANVKATNIGNLSRTIAQGRIIQATTESAINTELPGPIRAIVSRDCYGEAGLTPLIPKGSRLIGTYNTNLMGGQSRAYVMWTRVIRPDGVDVMINSPLVDRIGMAGIGGQVDTKFQQMFSRAVLASVITIGVAIGSDQITGGGQTAVSQNDNGSVTQSGDGATTATVNALNRLGSTTDGFLQRYLNLRQSILVDQGTPVNVFVNRDLIFPAEFTGARMVP